MFHPFENRCKNDWQTEHFDFLVNKAGTGVYASFAETTEEDFDHLMNIHLKGVFFLAQKLLLLINEMMVDES